MKSYVFEKTPTMICVPLQHCDPKAALFLVIDIKNNATTMHSQRPGRGTASIYDHQGNVHTLKF